MPPTYKPNGMNQWHQPRGLFWGQAMVQGTQRATLHVQTTDQPQQKVFLIEFYITKVCG
jgi:hypothetical protein